jgi:hypothetical protein
MVGLENIAGSVMDLPVAKVEPQATIPLFEQNPWDRGKEKDPSLTDAEKKLINQLLDSRLRLDNKSARDVIDSVSKRSGLPKDFIAATALQEGMNLAITNPDDVSEAYLNAKVEPDYPVDGFYNYGLDTFSDAFPKLVKKGYLTKDFKYRPYEAVNEQKQKVNTAAFRNNEDALLAKAAYLKDFMDNVKDEAKKKGVDLTDRELKYFTMAGYNGGMGSVKVMFDEMNEQKQKASDYIKTGSKKKAGVHKNVVPRMTKMDYLSSLFDPIKT